MRLAEQKLEIINSILQIEDEKILSEIQKILEKVKVSETEKGEEAEEMEYDARRMSFEEWNAQFEDGRDLDEYIPEYGMTLGEFRRMIYERERSEDYIDANDFHSFMEKLWK